MSSRIVTDAAIPIPYLSPRSIVRKRWKLIEESFLLITGRQNGRTFQIREVFHVLLLSNDQYLEDNRVVDSAVDFAAKTHPRSNAVSSLDHFFIQSSRVSMYHSPIRRSRIVVCPSRTRRSPPTIIIRITVSISSIRIGFLEWRR